jgi:hypothetical protein
MDETREGLAAAVEAAVEEVFDGAVAEIESFVGVARISAMGRGFAALAFGVATLGDALTGAEIAAAGRAAGFALSCLRTAREIWCSAPAENAQIVTHRAHLVYRFIDCLPNNAHFAQR